MFTTSFVCHLPFLTKVAKKPNLLFSWKQSTWYCTTHVFEATLQTPRHAVSFPSRFIIALARSVIFKVLFCRSRAALESTETAVLQTLCFCCVWNDLRLFSVQYESGCLWHEGAYSTPFINLKLSLALWKAPQRRCCSLSSNNQDRVISAHGRTKSDLSLINWKCRNLSTYNPRRGFWHLAKMSPTIVNFHLPQLLSSSNFIHTVIVCLPLFSSSYSLDSER